MRASPPTGRTDRPSSPLHIASAMRRAVLAAIGVVVLASCASTPTSSPVAPLSSVESPSGLYSLTPMLAGWSRITDAAELASDLDLAFVHESARMDARLYVVPGVTESLDDYVLARRSRIFEAAKVVAVDETRRFKDDGELTTISITHYRVVYPQATGWSSIFSGVLRGPSMTVEVLASGGLAPQNRVLLEDLVEGVRFSETGDAADDSDHGNVAR